MTPEEIESLYPEFLEYSKKKGYHTAGATCCGIKLWFEFICSLGKTTKSKSRPYQKKKLKTSLSSCPLSARGI